MYVALAVANQHQLCATQAAFFRLCSTASGMASSCGFSPEVSSSHHVHWWWHRDRCTPQAKNFKLSPSPPWSPVGGTGYRAWCCPCLVAGDVAEFAGNSWWTACLCQCACPCMHPLVTGPNRSQLKLVLGIEDNEGRPYQNPNRIWDQCLHLILPCTTLLQVVVRAVHELAQHVVLFKLGVGASAGRPCGGHVRWGS